MRVDAASKLCSLPVVSGAFLVCQRKQLLKGGKQLVLDAAACAQSKKLVVTRFHVYHHLQ